MATPSLDHLLSTENGGLKTTLLVTPPQVTGRKAPAPA